METLAISARIASVASSTSATIGLAVAGALGTGMAWGWWIVSPSWLSAALSLGAAAIAAGVARAGVGRLRCRLAASRADALREGSLAAAQVVHDLRTPLHSILLLSDTLLQRPQDASDGERIETIRKSGNAMLRIVDDLLDTSRMQAGHIRLDCAPFEMGRLLADTLDMAAPIAARQGVVLALDAPQDMTVRGDALRVQQVLMNLVGNAVKFTPRGEVRVTARRLAPGAFEFEVDDTGIGMDPATLVGVFEPFVQAAGSAGSMAASQRGTGLGLAIARDLARCMGGDITARSEPGMGTTMTFTCRLEEVAPTVPTTTAKHPADIVGAGSRKILVADDCAINRLIAEAVLTERGYAVTVAEDGREAIEAILATRFDAVLMDWHMPVMTGGEAAHVVRQAEAASRGPRLPIVAVTGTADADELARCVEMGMDAVLPKPFTAEQLWSTLADVLEDAPRPASAAIAAGVAPSPRALPEPARGPAKPSSPRAPSNAHWVFGLVSKVDTRPGSGLGVSCG